jgi:hypothetical protein
LIRSRRTIRAKRQKFVETFLDKLVNWDFAQKNFA